MTWPSMDGTVNIVAVQRTSCRPTFVSHGAAASSLADGPAETYDAILNVYTREGCFRAADEGCKDLCSRGEMLNALCLDRG